MTADAATKTRVLMVDDSKLMRMAAQKMLSDEFEVVTATDGQDGWDKLEGDTGIQVVFTDLSMPGMDGYGLLRKIRTADDAGIHNMPVIVVTGAENDEAAREEALELGATDFISKPFNSTDLLARARAHANYQRITKQLQEKTTTDALTGLVNKSSLLDRLRQDLAYAGRHQQPLALACLEIDNFKQLYLEGGKSFGDSLVSHVAAIIRSCIREEDTAGRISVAGFGLVLPASGHEGSMSLANRIRAQVQDTPLEYGGRTTEVSLSASVLTPADYEQLGPAEALDKGLKFLRTALKAGGNNVLADPKLYPEAADAASAAKAKGAQPLSIDALLQQVEQGRTEAVLEQSADIIERLAPLLKLLDDTQRRRLRRVLDAA